MKTTTGSKKRDRHYGRRPAGTKKTDFLLFRELKPGDKFINFPEGPSLGGYRIQFNVYCKVKPITVEAQAKNGAVPNAVNISTGEQVRYDPTHPVLQLVWV